MTATNMKQGMQQLSQVYFNAIKITKPYTLNSVFQYTHCIDYTFSAQTVLLFHGSENFETLALHTRKIF